MSQTDLAIPVGVVRYVVVTDSNHYCLKFAEKMGATLTLDARKEKIEDAQKKLGMKKGFDVAMEMSGSSDALPAMLPNMYRGAKIALLRILPPIPPLPDILSSLTN